MADTIERKKYHPMRWVKKTKSQDEWKKQLKIMIKKLEFNIHKSNFWRILSCLLCSLHFGCYINIRRRWKIKEKEIIDLLKALAPNQINNCLFAVRSIIKSKLVSCYKLNKKERQNENENEALFLFLFLSLTLTLTLSLSLSILLFILSLAR